MPLDPAASAARIAGFLRDVEQRFESPIKRDSDGRVAELNDLRTAAGELAKAASIFNASRAAALERGDRAALRASNQQLLRFERAFIDPEGLPGRPWYRHLIHAPKFSYEPETLPGVAEAMESGDRKRVLDQAARLASALRRASAQLGGLEAPPATK